MIKETWKLLKLLFSKGYPEHLEIYASKYYPFSGYLAMSWCGLLVCREKNRGRIEEDKETINHETIHLFQAKTRYTRWIWYYLSYLWKWITGAIYMFSWDAGYYTSEYEIEAYANEDNLEYLINYKPGLYKFTLKERKKMWKEHGGRYSFKFWVKDRMKPVCIK